MVEYKIKKEESGQKIEKYLRKVLNNTPLSLLYKTFRKRDVKVNDIRVNQDYVIKENDVIKVYLPTQTKDDYSYEVKKVEIKKQFDILYEDENILVVNKPVGLLVHDVDNKIYNTLTNQVISYVSDSYDSSFLPAPAHRLDRNTSGIVIFGKNIESLQILNNCFKEREGIKKHYLALVKGKVNKDGRVECELKKNDKTGEVKVVKSGGLSSISLYSVVKSNDKYSLLDVNLLTGRTHQIRVHMAYINHPVIGDKKYGDFPLNSQFYNLYKFENQFLHAYKIIFTDMKGKLSYLNGKTIISDLPKDKKHIIDKLF